MVLFVLLFVLVACDPDLVPEEDVEFTVTFETNGGTAIEEQIVVEGRAIAEPDVPSKEGHTFLGWYTDSTFNNVYDFSAPIFGDLRLHAKWQVNAYSIRYLDHDGSVLYETTFDYLVELLDVYTDALSRTGYTFLGWDTELPTTMPAHDLVLQALYDINSYTITFLAHDGSELSQATFDYNTDLSTIEPPVAPEREGFRFTGWDMEVPATMPDQDVVIQAMYVADQPPQILGLDDVILNPFDPFDPMEGVTASDVEDGDLTERILITENTWNPTTPGAYHVTYEVEDNNGNKTSTSRNVYVQASSEPMTITIMVGSVCTMDPFADCYTKQDKLDRQARQNQVESVFHVDVLYRNYPTSAAWGPSRIAAILQANIAEAPMADLYAISSDWIAQLAKGDAIVSVSEYLYDHGAQIDASYHEVGAYQNDIYGFHANPVTMSAGLFFNADLIEALGVDNPTQLYLDGNWNWTRFEAWATSVQAALELQGTDRYALGGRMSDYAQSMIPLNGGQLIDQQNERVSFTHLPALQTYDFLTGLYQDGLFEPNPMYDAGSLLWQTGKVAMHPGSLWFLNAANRWGYLSFEIGFVPYPVADDYTGAYRSPVSGIEVMALANQNNAVKEEYVFQVWNALQLWPSEAERTASLELELANIFADERYRSAYLDVYDHVFLDLIHALGISAYGSDGWTANIHNAIREDDAQLVVDRIWPVYQAALDQYVG
jgi:uncharacterized repeat protein (TIGR02543 family)